MKKKRIQYSSGGEINYHKSFDDLNLNTSVNYKNSNLNVNLNKNFSKGFSVNAKLNKVKGNKSSTNYTFKKEILPNLTFGVTIDNKQNPAYRLTYKKNF